MVDVQVLTETPSDPGIRGNAAVEIPNHLDLGGNLFRVTSAG